MNRIKLKIAQRGFTLVELLVALSLTTMALSMIGSSAFQALSVRRTWQGDVIATKEWRPVESWFAGDAMNARTTDLISGNPPTSSVTLSWVDGNSIPHTSTYSVTGNELIRDFDGVQNTLARNVVSSLYSLSGKVLRVVLEVRAENGLSETSQLDTYLRNMP